MKDKLGQRMKDQYESRIRYKLMRRCPTIIRLDGKAFHTYTKGLDKPFDEGLISDMQQTTKYLCENIQGVKCGYTQSDEISLLLADYDEITTQAWFDYNLQKMCSVSASYCTSSFNQLRLERYLNEVDCEIHVVSLELPKIAQFDSRVFQIADHEEVVNYFIWRYFDAKRNSVQMLAQSLYSPKELHGKNTGDMLSMCIDKKHPWDELDWSKKYGSFVIKNEDSKWEIKMPPMIDSDRNTILNLINYD